MTAKLIQAVLDINAAWSAWATRELGDPGYYESMQLANAISRAVTLISSSELASVNEGDQQ